MTTQDLENSVRGIPTVITYGGVPRMISGAR
jgi:hypothetical protein